MRGWGDAIRKRWSGGTPTRVAILLLQCSSHLQTHDNFSSSLLINLLLFIYDAAKTVRPLTSHSAKKQQRGTAEHAVLKRRKKLFEDKTKKGKLSGFSSQK
jgi:hypothetical protein